MDSIFCDYCYCMRGWLAVRVYLFLAAIHYIVKNGYKEPSHREIYECVIQVVRMFKKAFKLANQRNIK